MEKVGLADPLDGPTEFGRKLFHHLQVIAIGYIVEA